MPLTIQALGDKLDQLIAGQASYDNLLRRLADGQQRHAGVLDLHTTKLNELVVGQNAHTELLNAHTATLDGHTATLDGHTETLDAHTETLNAHTETLNGHTATLNGHTATLNAHTETLNGHTGILNGQTEMLEQLVRNSGGEPAPPAA